MRRRIIVEIDGPFSHDRANDVGYRFAAITGEADIHAEQIKVLQDLDIAVGITRTPVILVSTFVSSVEQERKVIDCIEVARKVWDKKELRFLIEEVP